MTGQCEAHQRVMRNRADRSLHTDPFILISHKKSIRS